MANTATAFDARITGARSNGRHESFNNTHRETVRSGKLEISENDILHGAALAATKMKAPASCRRLQKRPHQDGQGYVP